MTDAAFNPTWIWPWRPRSGLRAAIWRAINSMEPWQRGWRAVPVALGIGTIPILLGYAMLSGWHQPATGLALWILVWPSVVADRFFRAAGLVGLVVFSHSVIAIGLTVVDADRTARILPGSADYWRTTWQWVRHNSDVEYKTAVWLPRHAALFAVGTVFGYTSAGALPYVRGIDEIDLMNHYVGRLVRVSDRPSRAIAFGWHPWSFVRGLAFAILVFEVSSLSMERLTARTLSTRRRRIARWVTGIALVVLDGVIKVLYARSIREQLFENLRAETLAMTL